jgi:hydroxyacylglutathione hydrolase
VAKWANQTGRKPGVISQVGVAEVAEEIKAGRLAVIDVRGAAEFAAGHLPAARNIALGDLLDHLDEIPVNQPLVLQCLSGFRSSIAASLLASRGRTNMMNLQGGYQAWRQARQPVIVNIHP